MGNKEKLTSNLEEGEEGHLAGIAASILMRALYVARCARHDLLKPINALTTFVQYWDRQCDAKLHRLINCMHSTRHYRQCGWIHQDDPVSQLGLHTYADANFAGCPRTLRSTSGGQMHLEGPRSRFPIAARSVRQPCVSY